MGSLTYLIPTDFMADSSNEIANQMLVAQNMGKTTFGELATTVSKVSPIFNQLNLGTNELFSSLAVLTANGIATSESVSALKANFYLMSLNLLRTQKMQNESIRN